MYYTIVRAASIMERNNYEFQMSLLSLGPSQSNGQKSRAFLEKIKTTPLFTTDIISAVSNESIHSNTELARSSR